MTLKKDYNGHEHPYNVVYPFTDSLEHEKKMIGFKIGRAIGETIETIWFSCLNKRCKNVDTQNKFCHLLTSSEFDY